MAHLQARGVKPTVVRWYVIRTEHYIHTVAHPQLADHTPQDVTHYLGTLGRTGRITDWQYRQMVEAIQQALYIAGVAWAQEFAWTYWKASARTLSTSHPTIAREVSPTMPVDNGEQPRIPDTHPSPGRDTSATWRQALMAEIRRRGYSIRTEQAYTHWVEQFLRFCHAADPAHVGGGEVLAFLQHLAVARQVASNTQNQAPGLVSFRQRVAIQVQNALKGFIPREALLTQHAPHGPKPFHQGCLL